MVMDIFGAVFIIVLGTLFHFLYDWTHHNKFVGFFTAVNESTWEHLKLLILPSYLWLIAEYFIYGDDSALLFSRFVAIMAGLVVMPLLFYGYKAIFKRDIFMLDILAFLVAVVAEQIVFHILMQYVPSVATGAASGEIFKNIGLFGLIILFIVYLTHTYVPEHNFLSRDPITKKYGIPAHFDKKKSNRKGKK